MSVITDEMENDFTVDEMIGVVKYLELNNDDAYKYYLELLLGWREDGFGEVIVASCKDTML